MAAIVSSFILTVLAGLHVAWAVGLTWPETSEQDLARRVAGFEGVDRMPPPAASALVALLLLLGCHIVLVVSGLSNAFAPDWIYDLAIYDLAIWGMVAVFALRGGAIYTRAWRALTPVEPFATMDRRYYGPLCLCLAVLIAWVAIF
ncbi:MAG: DUF3995 domain-containing protein [Pelagimonas sp.]|uniref:DUF3995 domain-containing protein n=1 Tax=Pelagimonas sp. TaxID=2073170 RepID=UPI003D6B5012